MEVQDERTSETAQDLISPAERDDAGLPQCARIQRTLADPKLEFALACKDLLTAARDGKLNTFVQISVAHPTEQTLTRYANTEIVEGTRDPLFLTGVTFPSEYPIYEETKIKLSVYDVKDKSQETKHVQLKKRFTFLTKAAS
ncbi:PREDICTED: type II inositol 3,4-bisphosphate 4-phosphatase-like [Nanorana parkeri]|uniref:type II inositol 3,4-bisphosphate 4-phosphatase-like n=1 Tax=Nanorana parkeri TaxID=125878 RepID=UPI0008549170|nr:PREDICTED: type II inositol 3,4-bisphosphate 4-phosphatase-like [Nanorana parkeri]